MTDDREWVPRAACANTSLDAFFPARGQADREARSYCNRCPVRPECLDYALAHHIDYGIWGGESERRRRAIRAERVREARIVAGWRDDLAALRSARCEVCGHQLGVNGARSAANTVCCQDCADHRAVVVG